MQQQEHEDFWKLMDRAAIVTIMPNGKDFNDVTSALFLALRDYAFQDVRQAVIEHCRTNRFFPMLADIVTRIEGNVEDRAALAWSMVRKTIRRYGTSQNVRFPSPAIHYALDKMDGWMRLNRILDSDNEPWKFREFARFYRLGEKYASWGGEHGKETVQAYLPSEYEIVNRRGVCESPQKIYDAETGKFISFHDLPALKLL